MLRYAILIVSSPLLFNFCFAAPPAGVFLQKDVSENEFKIKMDPTGVYLNEFPADGFYDGHILQTINKESVIFEEISPRNKKHDGSTPPKKEDDDSFDSWSIVWYIASFGGLIAFFLIVSCSEWCCRRQNPIQTSQETIIPGSRPNTPTCEVPPPPAYELFAPPPYDTCFIDKNGEKREYDVYVVPVHAIRPIIEGENERRDSPPAYAAINVRTISAQVQNTPT